MALEGAALVGASGTVQAGARVARVDAMLAVATCEARCAATPVRVNVVNAGATKKARAEKKTYLIL